MKEIVQRDAPVLREKAKEVHLKDIKSLKIKKVIKDMKEALASQDDGVALAAPQIGVSLRVFIITEKIYDILYPEEKGKKGKINLVYINPKITKLSKEQKLLEEGCLSVRWLYGKKVRSTKATVSAYDEKGEKFERGGSGLIAQIFQHETDHLDGVLFIDNAEDLHELPPEKIPSRLKKETSNA
ncbi:MAG: peptide deformylase [Candidatus Pacebacteria bacterium]|nr:peptide deformylase [Candidatus Paceibacterota bacterium]